MKKTLMPQGLFLCLFLFCFYTPPTAAEKFPCTAGVIDPLELSECMWARDLSYPVMILQPSSGDGRETTPLLYLLGGPGSLALPQRARFQEMADTLNRVILVPAFGDALTLLQCADEGEEDAVRGIAASPEETRIYDRDMQRQKLGGCLAAIRDHSVPQMIGTEGFAESLQELRKHLVVTSWHVMGESFGARVALKLAEIDQPATESLVLDSPETPWEPGYWHLGANFVNALGRLGRICRGDFYCVGKRISLPSALLGKISAHDPGDSRPVPLKNVQTGRISAYARPTQEQLLISAFTALRQPRRATLLPYIAAASRQEAFTERYGLLLDQLLYPSSSLNFGMFHTIRCRELPLDRWYSALAEDEAQHPSVAPLLEYLAWRQKFVCDTLGQAPARQIDAPAPLNVRILLLTGGLDPITPADVARDGLRRQTRITWLNYDQLGHVVSAQQGCVMEDIKIFQTLGTIRETSCRRRDLRLRFYSPVVVR